MSKVKTLSSSDILLFPTRFIVSAFVYLLLVLFLMVVVCFCFYCCCCCVILVEIYNN